MKTLLPLLVLVVFAVPAQAQYAVEPLGEAAPSEVSDAIRAELQPTGLRVKHGTEVVADFWFRRNIPQKAGDGMARSYPNLPDTTLLGVARVSGAMKDNRDHTFRKGVFTIRHGLQPQDGNHAGSSEYIDFALFLSAKADTTVDGGFKTSQEMIYRSLSDGGVGHPLVFALLPPSSGPYPGMRKTAMDHWVLDVKAGDQPLSITIVGVYAH